MERGLVLCFELTDTCPNPMLLCGRIVLAARFSEVSFPQILAHTDCGLEAHFFE